MRKALAPALAVVALLGAAASDAGTAGRARGDWIVLGSDRDGTARAYAVHADGSRLTPLLGPDRKLVPVAVSGDGRTIAYADARSRWLYVSRADGTGLRRVVRAGSSPALSSDGKRLAFASGSRSQVTVVGANGQGLRHLGPGDQPSWSPDGQALVVHGTRFGKDALFVQPLRGRRRLLARAPGLTAPRWSPDGRWIAYLAPQGARNGVYVVRPDGGRRHRLVPGYVSAFAWSRDGGRLVVAIDPGHVLVVRPDGRVLRRLRLRIQTGIRLVAWSPDGRRLALEAGSDESGEIWVVGIDGRGLHRVVSRGSSLLVGWTRLAPVRRPAPPIPPSERVVSGEAVATRAPVLDVSADGGRAAFAVAPGPADCGHVVVWTPAQKTLQRFVPAANCGTGNGAGVVYDVELAGSRAAWAEIDSCGNYCDVALETATLARRRPVAVASASFESSGDGYDFHLHGNGDLLVFDDEARLVRIGAGTERCEERGDYDARVCSLLRSGRHAADADSVAGGLVAVREPDAVAIVDAHGTLERFFPFGENELRAARLDGGTLVVARAGLLEVYDLATGAGTLQRPLPSGDELEAVQGGVALLQGEGSITLLRLADGRSFTLAPGRSPVSADLDASGLYYSYATAGGGGRVVFVPRAEIDRRLGAG